MSSSCPDPRRLQGLLEGDVSATEAALLTAHLDDCGACQQRLEALAGAGHVMPVDPADDPLPSTAALQQAISEVKSMAPGFSGSTVDPPPPREPGPNDDPRRPAFLALSDKPGYLGRFGPYEVIHVIGRGGMGVVLKAHDPTLDRIVAIKVLSAQLASSDEAQARFMREARAVAAVTHDHIVAIHSVAQAAGLPYLVMPFVTGGSLRQWIDADGALPVQEAVRVGRQVALGLAAAHGRGLVHRDIKPTNILLDGPQRTVKLADFGLARSCDEAAITHTGFLAGTPQYMAPEQAMGQRVDHRADLFSLGAVLYTACTGRAPFPHASPLAAMRSVCDDHPPPVSRVNPAIPSWLDQLIQRLMAKAPHQRVQTAQELAQALTQAQPAPDASAPLVEAPSVAARSTAIGHRRPVRLAVLAACGVAVVGGASWWLIKGGSDPPGRPAVVSPSVEPIDPPGTHSPPDSTDSPHMSLDAPPVVPPGVPPESSWDTSDLAGGGVAAVSGLPEASVVGPAVVVRAGVSGADAGLTVSLTDALAEAAHGDAIELVWNGPMTVEPMTIHGKALVIRAAAGYEPTLEVDEAASRPLIESDSPLVLEGIGLQTRSASAGSGATGQARAGEDAVPTGMDRARLAGSPVGLALVRVAAPLYAANCRWLIRSPQEANRSVACVHQQGSGRVQFENCELYVQFGSVVHRDGVAAVSPQHDGAAVRGELAINNCVGAGFAVASVDPWSAVQVTAKRSTLVGGGLILFRQSGGPPGGVADAAWGLGLVRLQMDDSVLDFRSLLIAPFEDPASLSAQRVRWHGRGNVLSPARLISADLSQRRSSGSVASLVAQWRAFLDDDQAVAARGVIRYASGFSPTYHAVKNPQAPLTARLFEIASVKAMGRRKKHQIDQSLLERVGAQIEQVGPGSAYERFKRSDLYPTWTRAVRQVVRPAGAGGGSDPSDHASSTQ